LGLGLAFDKDGVEQVELLLAAFNLPRELVKLADEVGQLQTAVERDFRATHRGFRAEIELAVVQAGRIGETLAKGVQTDDACLQVGHAYGERLQLAQGLLLDPLKVCLLLTQSLGPGLACVVAGNAGGTAHGDLVAAVSKQHPTSQEAKANGRAHPAPEDYRFRSPMLFITSQEFHAVFGSGAALLFVRR